MAICQCLKANGQSCEREASKKKGTDSRFCWQHQNCTDIKTPAKKATAHEVPKKAIADVASQMHVLLKLKLDGEYLPNSEASVLNINKDRNILANEMFSRAFADFKSMFQNLNFSDIDIPDQEDLPIEEYNAEIFKRVQSNKNQKIIYGNEEDYSLVWNQSDNKITIHINEDSNPNKWTETRYIIQSFPLK